MVRTPPETGKVYNIDGGLACCLGVRTNTGSNRSVSYRFETLEGKIVQRVLRNIYSGPLPPRPSWAVRKRDAQNLARRKKEYFTKYTKARQPLVDRFAVFADTIREVLGKDTDVELNRDIDSPMVTFTDLPLDVAEALIPLLRQAKTITDTKR